jgi:hypothetical protein
MKNTTRSIFLGGVAVAGLSACGSATTSPPAVAQTTSTASTAAPAVATARPAGSPLVSWCSLKLGETRAAALAAMGAPNGHAAGDLSSLLGPGESTAEWDTDGDILLATFDAHGQATNLQAYAGAIGPQGASNISCAAFRH